MTTIFLRILCLCVVISLAGAAVADDAPSAVGPVLKLLKSGKVPESNLGRILDLVCSKGNEHDLAFVFSQASTPDAWNESVRLQVLESLLAAQLTRKVSPAGDLHELEAVLRSENMAIRKTGIELAGAWNVIASKETLKKIISLPETIPAHRQAALNSLVQIDPMSARAVIDLLLQADASFKERVFAITAMAGLDPAAAAPKAAQLMASAQERDDPQPIVAAFLAQQGGADLLADAITTHPPGADIAKLALRHMYSVGRSDQKLSEILSKVGGVADDAPLPTKEELAALVEEIRVSGDPVRGEAVFRRADLSCQKCHAVSKAGGQIGPDLSAVGATSPLEYLAMSILDPDQAIKEAYTTKVVLTDDGKIHQGIIVDQSDETLILKDTNGVVTTIARADIEEEIAGKSLMPKGLVKFMTHAEFLDVVKFLAELGKPGPYAVRSTERVQRWQILTSPAAGLLTEVPNVLLFEDEVLAANTWESAYAMVNGTLNLAELSERTRHNVLYLRGELIVRKAGSVRLSLMSQPEAGLQLWVGKTLLTPGEDTTALGLGTHPVTVRVDLNAYSAESILLEFSRPPGSLAEFAVVDGQ